MGSLPASLMVSVSGFRGRVGEGMTPEVATRLAAAFGVYVAGGAVVLGRDSRPSGEMLRHGVLAGLMGVGVEVWDLGIVPTPTVQVAVEDLGAAGGVVITASHNPEEWNALKFISGRGMALSPEEHGAFLRVVEGEGFPYRPWNGLGRMRADPQAVGRHLQRILSLALLDRDRIRGRHFRVALDCGHGTGGVILPQLLKELGCELDCLYQEPHGRFPHPPEPVPEHLTALGEAVQAFQADLGLAVDADADRLALLGSSGSPLGEDLTLTLATEFVLRHSPGPAVINLSTTALIEAVARHHGCPVFRTPIGEAHVIQEMLRVGATIGGEGNGGVIYPQAHLGRDAAVAAALILALLAEEERALEDLVAQLPPVAMVKARVACPRVEISTLWARLRQAYPAPEVDERDGLWLGWPVERSWLHLRPSRTEPILRVIAEAPDREAAQALVDRATALLQELG